jgi:hypothetical protein
MRRLSFGNPILFQTFHLLGRLQNSAEEGVVQ